MSTTGTKRARSSDSSDAEDPVKRSKGESSSTDDSGRKVNMDPFPSETLLRPFRPEHGEVMKKFNFGLEEYRSFVLTPLWTLLNRVTLPPPSPHTHVIRHHQLLERLKSKPPLSKHAMAFVTLIQRAILEEEEKQKQKQTKTARPTALTIGCLDGSIFEYPHYSYVNLEWIYDGILKSYLFHSNQANKVAANAWAQLGLLVLTFHIFDILRERLSAMTGKELLATMCHLTNPSYYAHKCIRMMKMVPELAVFPPGLLPLCVEYVDCDKECGFFGHLPTRESMIQWIQGCYPQHRVDDVIYMYGNETRMQSWLFTAYLDGTVKSTPHALSTVHGLSGIMGVTACSNLLLDRAFLPFPACLQPMTLTGKKIEDVTSITKSMVHLFLLESLLRLGYTTLPGTEYKFLSSLSWPEEHGAGKRLGTNYDSLYRLAIYVMRHPSSVL